MQTKVKTTKEIADMRKSGRILALVLKRLKTEVVAGITTKELSSIALEELKKLGGKPVFLGYHGFPDVLCVSVNEEVVHGIPSSQKKLNDGDIVSLDLGVNYGGMITDSAISLIFGKLKNKTSEKLLECTKRALETGINIVKDGVRVGDIAAAIQKTIEQEGYGVVRELVGHGVGHQLHEEPNIPNYGHSGTGQMLKKGMTIAIEPMTTLGSYDVYTAPDGWTVRTRDNSLSAHYEHTVLITQTGSEILTAL